MGVVPERLIQGERFIPQKETLDDSVAQLEAAPTKVIQHITGNTIKAYDNDNKGYEFKYAVVSADDLIASHDTNMNQNPSYPQELQPRDRERIASKIQVDKMAVNIQPNYWEKVLRYKTVRLLSVATMLLKVVTVELLHLRRCISYKG